MRVLDLFSGIGGFSLGLERAGMTTVAFCERDPFCRSVLAQQWPHLPIHEDIRELDGQTYRGSVELVCGGFPCQPFSVAGKQKGKADDRHLWPEMFRVIAQSRPCWVVGENVPGIIGLGLDEVLSDLESEGYACSTFILPACAVDAPHRRDRVWVVAHADRKIEPDGSLDEREMARQLVADAESQRVERHASAGIEKSHPSTGPRVPRCARAGGRAAVWEPESGMGRVADGIPHRVDRLRALGNAVVPQLVEEIGRLILACEAAK